MRLKTNTSLHWVVAEISIFKVEFKGLIDQFFVAGSLIIRLNKDVFFVKIQPHSKEKYNSKRPLTFM